MSLAGLGFVNWGFMGFFFFSALAAPFAAGAAFAAGALAAGPPLAAAAGALFGINFWRRRRPAALTDGLTMTRPPSAPGTAPLISSKLRGTSISTMRRFSMVRLRTPMWPDMRLPLKTRPGVWR